MLEIGDYIRTADGYIGKLIQINKRNWNYLTVDCKHQVRDGGIYPRSYLYLKEEDIKKYSKEVKDLIEVGDYVNDYKVIKITPYTFTTIEQGGYKVHHKECVTIKTILTKERFESEKYEVGE